MKNEAFKNKKMSLDMSSVKPLIAISVKNVVEARKASRYADLIEIRLDHVISERRDPIGEVRKISRAVDRPLIATNRSVADGGLWRGTKSGEGERLGLFRALYPYVQAIDIELYSGIRDVILKETKRKNVFSIVSFHDFNGTGTAERIRKIILEMSKTHAGMLKIACLTRSFEDTLTLFAVLKSYTNGPKNKTPLSLIGMGMEGAYTRLIFPYFGSKVTYGFLGKGGVEYAPGQIPAETLKKHFGGGIPFTGKIYDDQF